MKYSVDRIENNIAILEELTTKEKIEIDISLLPPIKEGSILKFENNSYILDKETEEKRREDIRERFNRLKNKS